MFKQALEALGEGWMPSGNEVETICQTNDKTLKII